MILIFELFFRREQKLNYLWKSQIKNTIEMKKIFTQLPKSTQNTNYQPNTKKINQNTIGIFTQLQKCIA